MKTRSIFWHLIKYGLYGALCLLFLLNVAQVTLAATAVPREVNDAVDSVVYIAHAVEEKQYNEKELSYIKETDPDRILDINGKKHVLNGSGSGFIIKNEGGEILIATNNHVVESDFRDIFVWLTRQKVAHAEVVFAVPEQDLSVIRIRETTNKKAVCLAEEDGKRGDAVYAVGFPASAMGDRLAVTSAEATITDGIIGAIRTFTLQDRAEPISLLQINAAINPGNSGGPLFNEEGNVIGINTLSKSLLQMDGTVPQGIFGAISVTELKSLLDKYGIDISVPAEPETTVTTDSVVQPNSDFEKKNHSRDQILVIFVDAVVVCTGVLMTVFYLKLKKRKEKICTDEKVTEEIISDSPGFEPIGPLESGISMTSDKNDPKDPENNRPLSDYLHKITLTDEK